MPDRRQFQLLLVMIILAALAVRLPHLSRRPMHTDEAVHALKTAELLQGKSFQYDQRDYHGPTLYFSAWVNARLQGVTGLTDLQVQQLRLVPVIYGSLLIAWLFALFRHWPPLGLIAAAVLLSISTPLVYYSRYYIMESLLLCFHLGFTVAMMRYLVQPSTRWLIIGSVCMGLMFATKETALLIAAAAVIAAVVAIARAPDRQQVIGRLRANMRPWHLPVAALLIVTVFVILLSSFGTNAANIGDYLGGYGSHLQRAMADPLHAKPWYYYGRMLIAWQWGDGPVWSEYFVLLLGAVGIYDHLKKGRVSPSLTGVANSFLVWNTLALLIMLSLIPYKTPWNMLVVLGGMILLAGHGLVVVADAAKGAGQQKLVGALLLVAVTHLGWQTWAATGRHETSPVNPYVYAHTSPDLQRLVGRLHQIAQHDSRRYELPLQVIASGHDYWPLPWDLRNFSRVYWWDAIDSTVTPADIIILRTTHADRQTMEFGVQQFIYDGFPRGQKHLYAYLFTEPVSLRPGVELLTLVRQDLLNQDSTGIDP